MVIKMINEVNKAEFERLIKSVKQKTLAEFYTKSCPACKSAVYILEEAEKQYPEVTFCKIDCEENAELAKSSGVSAVPTFVLAKDGREVSRSVGALSFSKLSEFIQRG